MTTASSQYPIIKAGKLMIFHNGSFEGIGVRNARASIKQMEASARELQPATQARLALLKEAVELWENR